MVVARVAWAVVCAMAMASVLCTPAAGGAAGGAPPRKAAGSPEPTQPPTDLSECNTVIYDMSDCLGYVSPFSNVSVPPETCCGGIKEVVRVNPWCLCDALKEGDNMDVQVDMSRAAQLPAACKIPVPDLNNCTNFKGEDDGADAGAPSSGEAPESSPSDTALPSAPTAGSMSPATSTSTSTPTAGGPASSDAQKPTVVSPRAPAPAPSASAALPLPFHCISIVISLAVATCFHF